MCSFQACSYFYSLLYSTQFNLCGCVQNADITSPMKKRRMNQQAVKTNGGFITSSPRRFKISSPNPPATATPSCLPLSSPPSDVQLKFPRSIPSGKENTLFGFDTPTDSFASSEGGDSLDAEEGGSFFDTLFSPMFKFFRKGVNQM